MPSEDRHAELENRRALVTGGTRGIGRAIACRLHGAGASVIVTGAGSESRAPEGCSYRQVDLNDEGETARFADELARAGNVDVLINNAGLNAVSPFTEIRDADFDLLYRVNLRGPMTLSRAVVPGMRARGWGRIVNITSVFAHVSKPGRGSYSASKFGLAGLTSALAVEVAADGILVNSVAPGFVDTELTRRVLGDEGIAKMVSSVPAGRLAQPEEIAEAVVFLSGSRNTFISGHSLVVDGGFTCT